MSTLSPEVAALWRTAGARIVAVGLPDDIDHREELVLVAGALAAAQAQAYATESEPYQFRAFELLTADALDAWSCLSRVELLTVEMTVARCWRTIAVEVGRLRNVGEAAA